MSTSTFTVTIQMLPDTLEGLILSDFSLFAYGAVQCSDRAAQPLVWMTTQQLSEATRVTGAAQFAAYTAPGATASRAVVPGFSVPIALDQTLTVQDRSGTGTVTEGGDSGAITIFNDTTTPLECGISQVIQGATAPVCVMPLHGDNGQMILPVPSILLLFSTESAVEGTIAGNASGAGVLLDLGSEPNPTVSFDINRGWSWGGATWGREVAFGTPLAPLLTPQNDSLATLAVEMFV
jgi:hypothetical protein